ncbi:hypothetical protein [Streptomyces sp. NPDC006335]
MFIVIRWIMRPAPVGAVLRGEIPYTRVAEADVPKTAPEPAPAPVRAAG